MKFSTTAVAAALSAGVLATPIQKRAVNDAEILNFALTLEHLEDTFYREALNTFTEQQFASAGFGNDYYSNLLETSKDESTHVSFLTSALQAAGVVPVSECTYDFGYTNVKGFAALSSILEGVGVSAYLGAAQYISNKGYLTAAASILTVEARHNAFIRDKLGEAPFAYPFDTPLDFDEVYTLASAFITGCPANNSAAPLPTLKAFPSLSILNATSPLLTNDTIYLITPDGTKLPKNTMAQWASITGPIMTPVKLSTNSQSAWTTVPEGLAGQSYVVLTQGSKVNDMTIVAGPAIIEVASAPGN